MKESCEWCVKENLDVLIHISKDLERSLMCFNQLENPRAFSTKQNLISSCKNLINQMSNFVDHYESM